MFSRPSFRQWNFDAHQRHELDAGRGLAPARRSRRTPHREHRAAQLPAADGGLHPARAGGRRSRGAARHPRVPGALLWRDAVLPRVSRLDLALRRDPPARGARHPRRHGAQRLPAHHDLQRSRRERRRAAARAGVGRGPSRLQGHLPQLVERAQDLGQGAGHRPRGCARIVDGEFSLDPDPGRRAAAGGPADGGHGAAAADGPRDTQAPHRRRQLRRQVRAARRGRARHLEGRRGRDPRAAERSLGGGGAS